MNRLQKKCLIATAGTSPAAGAGIVLLRLLHVEQPKPDDTQVLDVIPANLIDAAFNSGVKGAQPPPPTPIVKPPEPQPTPQPPQPKPVVTPADRQAGTELVKTVEKLFKPEPEKMPPDDVKPVESRRKPAKPKRTKSKSDLKPVVRNTTTVHGHQRRADAAREGEKRQRDARLKAIAQRRPRHQGKRLVVH